ncbi:MAG: PD-(D/E)XK nuclease family transposase, partial [Clostridia bacterium]|nr:PD-(D/E)XK nuclease family transposase [Clostridia bacterium]
MSEFIMLPKVDFAFKELMRNDIVRKGFLSAVLNIEDTKIKSTVLLNTNLPKEHEDEKQGILDVRLIMNDDTEIDIEIQLAYMSAWADRSTFYVSKMLVEQVG